MSELREIPESAFASMVASPCADAPWPNSCNIRALFMPTTTENAVKESYRAMLESLTPAELAIEYARVFREIPPMTSTSGDLFQQMLAEFLERSQPKQ